MPELKTPQELADINAGLTAHNEAVLAGLGAAVDTFMQAATALQDLAGQLAFSEDRQVNLIKDICVQTASNAVLTLEPNVVAVLQARAAAHAD